MADEEMQTEEETTEMNELADRFSYIETTDEQKRKMENLRTKATYLAYEIETGCPSSRDKSLALTKLEESIMWANKAISRQ